LTSNITNTDIDELYNHGLKNGALGGKLLGAGGGGFLLFVAKEGEKEKLLSSLSDSLVVPFQVSSSGTKILYDEG
jgi:D-glycero-alpha-D-manno-heptose-7-phosphate kinase